MGQFERIKYPDGQIGAKFSGIIASSTDFNMIKERINSYEDLFYVRSIADIIKYQWDPKHFRLFIPCMFGQRSDRRFDCMQSFDLKLITDIINECGFSRVSIFDPHSDVCLALIKNSEKISSFTCVNDTVEDIRSKDVDENRIYLGNLTLVSPDAGAYKKVFEYGQKLNLPVMAAVKYRDKDGNISLSFTQDVKDKDCLIVDDLCDGGYTFELLAKALKENGARKVYLYISHGIFSKGFVKLIEAGIERVYCTNSVRDIEPDVQRVFRTSQDMYPDNAVQQNYVKQFKIV